MQVGAGLGAWLGCGQQRPHVPSGAGSFRLLPHHTHHPHNAQAHAAVARRFAAAAVASNQMGCHRLCCLVLAWLASRWRPACAVQQAASWATSCIVPSAVHVAQHVVHASYLARSHIPNPQSGPATWRSCARPCPSWSAAACGRPARCAGYDSLFNIVPCTGCTLCTLGSCPTAFGCRSQRCCAPFALALLGSQPAAADGSCTVFFFFRRTARQMPSPRSARSLPWRATSAAPTKWARCDPGAGADGHGFAQAAAADRELVQAAVRPLHAHRRSSGPCAPCFTLAPAGLLTRLPPALVCVPFCR